MIGSRLGVYHVIEHIGRGGMADVYLAEDHSIGRQVAVKVLPAELVRDSSFIARFEREVKIIASLQHPNILPVHAYGEHEGQPYIVMAYLPGGTLSEEIERSPGGLPLDRIAFLLDRLASALDYAHRRGIVHRDFKPSNVLLDDEGNPYIADFGIAKATADSSSLTGSGIIGTPNYMAPEMAQRDSITPLIDIYALGVSLFQMLTGELPYPSDTPVGVLLAHATQPIPNPRSLRPDLPIGVVRALTAALAKQPDQRTASAGALAEAFRAGMGSAPAAPAEALPRDIADDPVTERLPQDILETAAIPEPAKVPPRPRPARPEKPLVPPSPRPTRRAERPAPAGRGRRRGAAWLVVGPLLIAALLGVAYLAFRAFSGPAAGPAASIVTATATPDPAFDAGALAEDGVATNSAWAPFLRDFDGVTMALVPVGCFSMGSDGAAEDESPAHLVCFEAPFWIDQTEVSNAQVEQFAGQIRRSSNVTDPDRPRERVTWREAAAFCALRGARLPTEAEWEYAARGPDALLYPWGNSFDEFKALMNTSITGTVGSNRTGASWVGALDLSGNVYEWVADFYGPYSAECVMRLKFWTDHPT